MPDGTTRLLDSLKQFVSVPDTWSFRSLLFPSQPATPFYQALEERADDLRRAFPFADPVSIAALTAICTIVSVPGGTRLVIQAEQPEAIYVVITGRLAVDRGQQVRLGPGDVIGDVEFITGAASASTVKALRTSEVLRIATGDLQAASERCPGVLLAISSGVVHRLQAERPASVAPVRPTTICVVPVDATIDATPILLQIADSLTPFGSVTMLSAEQAAVVRLSYFNDKPHVEIARELDIPLGTVKSRVRLAMQRLRALLDDLQ